MRPFIVLIGGTVNRWIGITSGGILGLMLVIAYSNFFFFSNNSKFFVIINIITLILLFSAAYLIVFKLVKNRILLNRMNWITINIMLGTIFGLIAGYFSDQGEIHWFILFFIIISLIPIVNFIVVTFWLGATVFIILCPDVLIPILNGLLPTHIADASIRWVIGLPLFSVPLLMSLGYWITIMFGESHRKGAVVPSWTFKQRDLKKEIKNYEDKLKKWVADGYNITLLEEKQKSRNLSTKLQDFKIYESKIYKLKKLEKDLLSMELKGFDYEIISIKKKLKNLNKIDEIKTDLSTLRIRIKRKIEKLIDETDKEIKMAICSSTEASDSKRLSALKILQADLIDFSRNFESGGLSSKETMEKVEELYNQAIVLHIPGNKKTKISNSKKIETQNYYNILNVKPNATQEQIKKMFKRLSLAYHPDKEEDTGVDGDQKFRMIIEAYDVLKNSDKRRKYDAEIGI